MVIALLSATAFAWDVTETPEGDPFYFSKLPIRWVFDTEGSPQGLDAAAQAAAVAVAFEAWTKVSKTEIEFLHDPGGPPQGLSRIFWADEWDFDPNFLAVTTTEASSSGDILAFDMVFNPNTRWTTDPNPLDMDFQNTVTHEIGHGLGFAHSDVEDATMYAKTLPGDTDKRDLAADDVAGMQFLYQPRMPEKTPLERLFGCNSIGTGNTTTSLVSLSVLFLSLRRRPLAAAARHV